MLENDSKKIDKQPVGMSSRMVDVNPSSETCNAVRYKLTPQIIHQIFFQSLLLFHTWNGGYRRTIK